MPSHVQRRDFLKSTAALGAGYWLGTSGVIARGAESPNEKLNLALIGIGGQGGDNLNGVSNQNIVALCDVDESRGGKGFEQFPRAKRFHDFRKLFDEVEKQIDAVVISTPDHTHFHPTYWAFERGKHVYLEKPLAHNVWEVRKLTDMAREKKLATQLGVQRHVINGIRNAVALVQVRRDRRCEGMPFVDRRRSRHASDPHRVAARPAAFEMGPVARTRRRAAVPRDVLPIRLAVLVGLRHG